ncbi:TPA: alpha/beta hydrolase [Clostridioides difficile]|nr:alpha/beta hydrolase [Clostridioides difficile]HDO9659532.1 alpha/beta hydrolase [Clostridioides difficile]
MSFDYINPIQQFNFQINRVLTYGELACNRQEVIKAMAHIQTFSEWNKAWLTLAEKAEREKRWLHAAYYYCMVEFFLKADDEQKSLIYKKCISNFYQGFEKELHLEYCKQNVPFEQGTLNCIKISAAHSKGTILICGGYDSFIEEFVLQVSPLASKGYTVILFDGPGQGDCIRENLFFRYDFEKPTSAVIDFYHLNCCAMVGISWGGYFALRSATYEKRIIAAVAYDVMDNGLEVMTHIFPAPICLILRVSYRKHWRSIINAIANRLRKKSVLADWALSQGMYITGTKTVYDFYQSISKHTLKDITPKLTQEILLLGGEKDHYIPVKQFYRLRNRIQSAKSLTSHLFTEAEGGEQHCQIGNHIIATNLIVNWLDTVFANK